MIGSANGTRIGITGLGVHVPERVVTNDDLAQYVDTSDEWIVERTGIHERRMAADDEALTRAAEVNAQFRPVELSGETVTRPAGPQSRTVHAFLRHLRDKGLDCVPEPLSLTDGTEVLRFIDGESGGDGWRHQHDERGLRSAARLLRRIHDASADWVPPPDAVFDAPPTTTGGDVFAHGDPGPWNFVWRDGEAVALLDWDYLHPATQLDDVAYALLWFAPMRDDDATLEWHHFPTVPDRRARIDAFLDAYGQPVPVLDPSTGNLEREALLDLIRLFYRQEQKEPTQIDPEGTLGKENWRESSIAIPEAAKGGKALLRLYYNLSPYAPVEQGTLVEEKAVPIE